MANAALTSAVIVAFTLLNCWFVYISFTPRPNLELQLTFIIASSNSNSTSSSQQQTANSSSSGTSNLHSRSSQILGSPFQDDKCDVSKGNWIPDSTPPLYNNETCRFIQPNQNCVKNGRPDTTYVNWRWKPDACELPFLDPTHFLELMRNRKMIFIGDSMARNHMQSLLCALAQVDEPHKLEKPEVIFFEESEKEMRWGFDRYNFTLTHIWSPFLVGFKAEGEVYNVFLDAPDEIWSSKIHDYDVALVSTGYWYYRPSVYRLNNSIYGCNPCNGELVNFTKIDQLEAYRLAHERILGYLVNQYQGSVILRTVTVDHFEHGAWYSGGVCNRTRPFTPGDGHSLPFMSKAMNKIQVDEIGKASKVTDVSKLNVLDVTYSAFMRPDGHPNFFKVQQPNKPPQNDCLHWCLPGAVDMWNQLIYHKLKSLQRLQPSERKTTYPFAH